MDWARVDTVRTSPSHFIHACPTLLPHSPPPPPNKKLKKALKDDDASKDDVVAQAHIEEFAFKLFESADNEDRAGRFHT